MVGPLGGLVTACNKMPQACMAKVCFSILVRAFSEHLREGRNTLRAGQENNARARWEAVFD